MPALDVEFLGEDVFAELFRDREDITITKGLSLATFAAGEADGEGYFAAGDSATFMDEQKGNVWLKVTVGTFSFRRKNGSTSAEQLAAHRERTRLFREAILRDDLDQQLTNRIPNFTVFGVRFDAFRTYRTDNHIVSVIEISLACCGAELALPLAE